MRIYTSASDPVDFCRRCFPDEQEAVKRYGLARCGEGPDGRGDCFDYDSDHPPYEDDLDDTYRCEKCGRKLTEEDNGW